MSQHTLQKLFLEHICAKIKIKICLKTRYFFEKQNSLKAGSVQGPKILILLCMIYSIKHGVRLSSVVTQQMFCIGVGGFEFEN